MHIQFAEKQHTEQIIFLWQQCFGDSPEYISFYLQHHPYQDHTLLLALEGDVVLAMLSLLPASLVVSGEHVPVRYVYAVGTDIRFRGRGLSTALLDKAAQICLQRQEEGLFLIPASQSLFSFYQSRGFFNAFGLSTQTIDSQQIWQMPGKPSLSIGPIDINTLFTLRNQAFNSYSPYIEWDGSALSYAVLASKAAGGGVLGFYADKNPLGYVFYEPFDGQYILKEYVVPDLYKEAALCTLHEHLQGKSYILRSPGQTPFGMLRPVSKKLQIPKTLGYTGLILD